MIRALIAISLIIIGTVLGCVAALINDPQLYTFAQLLMFAGLVFGTWSLIKRKANEPWTRH